MPPISAPDFANRYLTGTPLDWRQYGIKFERDPIPSRPVYLTAKHLEYAIGDGIEMDIIDMRSPHVQSMSTAILGTRRLLPHQIENEDTGLLKRRWLILVDNGDGVALPIAERLYSKGYVLIAVLDGGYPAWLDATQR